MKNNEIAGPIMPSEAHAKYSKIAERLKQWISSLLPAGGLVKLDGTPGIGKNTLVDGFLAHQFQNTRQQLVHIDLDGFAESKELRREWVKAVAKAGKIRTEEFSKIYQVEKANAMLTPVIQFVGSHGDPEEECSFVLPGPFVHGGGANHPRSARLRRGDIVVVDAEYVHLFVSIRTTTNPSISIRLTSSTEQVQKQWTARTKSAYCNDPEYLDARLKYHQLATLPSVEKYENETCHLVNFFIRHEDFF
jgi:hypothetical protein